MLRSQEMSLYQLIMPRESAWAVMDQLGYMGKVEIIDHDPSIPLIARPFANYIKRCDDLLNKLNLLIETAQKLTILKQFQISAKTSNKMCPKIHTHQYLDTLEDQINSKVNSFLELNRNHEQLLEQENIIIDQLDILQECRIYLGDDFFVSRDSKIDYFIGTLKQDEIYQFQRMVFRVSKGNAFVHIKLQNSKAIYIVMFPDQGMMLKKKLQKVQESMSLNKFSLPLNLKEFDKISNELTAKLKEIKQLIELTNIQLNSFIQELLKQTEGVRLIDHYNMYISKEKELYIQLNKLKMQGNLFLGELWIPKKDSAQLNEVLLIVKERNRDIPGCQISQKVPHTTPPTYFVLNEFTQVFQQIVNTYGIARYREINPALFTIITFPFLFGIMFGDIGHGFCLLTFGIYNIFYKFEPFHEFRYLILLMGFFSFYSGWIYNDFVSLSLNLFGSCYVVDGQMTPNKPKDCTYPFGLDPAWGDNLEFDDSFKMKLSVIIAYFHMCLGICLSGCNFINKKDTYGFCCKFLPQILFLTATIGYMDFLIIFKWVKSFSPEDAPSIINTMITMVLSFGSVEGPSMWSVNSQELIQSILIIIAVVSIPWMWFSHIIKGYQVFQRKNNVKIKNSTSSIEGSQVIELQLQTIQDETQQEKSLLQTHDHNDLSPDEEFTELIVHETIETIEFVLGVISNTASYLRLWALSLAHSQLADVFYSLILSSPMTEGSIIGALLRYPIWALVSFGVLMCMDTMECFLHSLRLHWVEFQNKFYKGDGVEFHVYSL
ncbi:unnamed protein product (macronuclear) [Paramecium tetraurelia]|uniref:V-type proton ATPase subunit a n=1 Tax=Paramecium tetraurelia TaxID=5888 RepID=Q3SDC7_PARTE|nr:uncharacterized protein GSPATT00036763001 [Paramecium tetraurelia]CAI43259.1 V-ATPase a subunit 4_1 isotype of the V0 sector [Paramecium tetraurelia]CAK67980.1 unnamed protein product [Paramecium tetraurelia]|eukprot:XP_001435377.1 hypothetical protein (macronuclear) [Paramecium tetraurelia strain d4-2]